LQPVNGPDTADERMKTGTALVKSGEGARPGVRSPARKCGIAALFINEGRTRRLPPILWGVSP
jgi:hypothetical protein